MMSTTTCEQRTKLNDDDDKQVQALCGERLMVSRSSGDRRDRDDESDGKGRSTFSSDGNRSKYIGDDGPSPVEWTLAAETATAGDACLNTWFDEDDDAHDAGLENDEECDDEDSVKG